MTDLMTCRYCHMSNFEWHHPAAKSAFVKIGPRHSAHLYCLAKNRKGSFLKTLPTYRLEGLPFFEIQALGLEQELRDEIARRGFGLAITPVTHSTVVIARKPESAPTAHPETVPPSGQHDPNKKAEKS